MLIDRLLLTGWTHPWRGLIDDGVIGRRRRGGGNGSEQTDGSCAAVHVEDGPEWKGDVHVHQQGGCAAVSHHGDLTVVREMEFNLVAQDGSVCHILGNDPVFRSVKKQLETTISISVTSRSGSTQSNVPVKELVGIVWKISRAQGSRIAGGEAKAHTTDVDRLGLNDLYDPGLARVDGTRRHDVAVAEFGFVADGCSTIRTHTDIDAVGARVQSERLEDGMAVVTQGRWRREVLQDGRRRLSSNLNMLRLLSGHRDGRQRQSGDLVGAAAPVIQIERVH